MHLATFRTLILSAVPVVLTYASARAQAFTFQADSDNPTAMMQVPEGIVIVRGGDAEKKGLHANGARRSSKNSRKPSWHDPGHVKT